MLATVKQSMHFFGLRILQLERPFQMRLRRKKAEEILLTGPCSCRRAGRASSLLSPVAVQLRLLKHCEAACKVYRLRSDAT